jgi:flagellar protein FliL
VGFLARGYLTRSKGAAAAAEAPKETEKVKSTLKLDSFLVNLSDQDGTRFVKVSFQLGLDETKLGEEYAGDPNVLGATRDAIILILTTKSSDDLLTLEGKEKLKQEIRERVNKVLPKGKVVEIHILDFVVQL